MKPRRTNVENLVAHPIVPVILAGGQGTRLWPMSRAARPKQFLDLLGPSSLFQQTLERVADRDRYGPALVLTNTEYRFIVAEQAIEAGADLAAILLEPAARNTAAAIAAAAVYAVTHIDPDAVLHVLPSDHAVTPDAGYWASVDAAAAAARQGYLVTFGVEASAPETGYGYIRRGADLGGGVFSVAQFTEKPDLERARQFLASGEYSWNSGMFMIGAQAFLDICETLAPQTHEAVTAAIANARADLDFIRIEPESFSRAPDVSVDVAVFERTDKAVVIPVSYAWSDLGSWDAVWRISDKDAAGNATMSAATLSNTGNSLVVSDKAHVVIEGLDDVAVIASEDAIFVGRLSEAQRLGPIVKQLRAAKETAGLTEIHQTAYRPWGGYSSILFGERFQVKRLFVHPGKKLSLQRHHHRSEHWVVVRGTAEVTIDNETRVLSENQSIYLPLGCTHRLANPGKIMLELIEVQTGSYLGEDDIVRIEDEFGRA
jgi:mannose-1-phosphate guanylyltransferase